MKHAAHKIEAILSAPIIHTRPIYTPASAAALVLAWAAHGLVLDETIDGAYLTSAVTPAGLTTIERHPIDVSDVLAIFPRLAKTVSIRLTPGGRTAFIVAPHGARRMYRAEWKFHRQPLRWWTFDTDRNIGHLWVSERIVPLRHAARPSPTM